MGISKVFPNIGIEYSYLSSGKSVVGIDEVGRGSLMGPVVSAAIFISGSDSMADLTVLRGIQDSKLISAQARNKLYKKLISTYPYAIGQASCKEIDRFGIRYATYLSMSRAYRQLISKYQIDYVLIDGRKSVVKLPISNAFYFTHGDNKIYSIAAASIIAKVYRDKLIIKLHEKYPCFNWKANKGYATLEHRKAIREYGISPYHRRTFVSKIIDNAKKQNRSC